MTSSTLAPMRRLPAVARIAIGAAVLLGAAVARVDPFAIAFFIVYAIPGFILADRRPRELLGWLLLAMAFGFLGTTVPLDVDVAALQAGTASWNDFLLVWLSSWTGYLTFTLFVALMLVFPSGHLPVRRRRAAQLLLLGCAFLVWIAATGPYVGFNPDQGVASVSVPNRFAVLPLSPLWAIVPPDALIFLMLAAMAIGVGSMLVRFRRATGVERLQLRWLVASLAFVVTGVAAGLASLAVLGDIGGAAWMLAAIAFPTVPLSILIAVTRYRLYEIDRLISRTLSWLLVTVVLGVVFAGAVIGLQAALAPFTANNTLAVAASTLLAAALFQPVRSRIQRLVDRRFNRARLDAERLAAHFAGHVRDEVDLAALRAEFTSTVHDAVAPVAVGVWLRAHGDAR